MPYKLCKYGNKGKINDVIGLFYVEYAVLFQIGGV